MSKLPLLYLSLFGLPLSLEAQYDDILKNPDISWAAEHTADFSLNPSVGYNYYYFTDEPTNELNVIQLSAQPTATGLYRPQDLGRYFSQKIFAGIQGGAFAMFEDEDLEIPMSKEKLAGRIVKIDTVVARAPEDPNEPDFDIVRNDIIPEQIVFFRVRQVFYYNKTEKKFGARILAIAPVLDKKDDDGNFMAFEPLVWLKIEAPPKNLEKIEPRDFPYVVETKMANNAPRFGDFKLKKGRIDFLKLIVNEVAKPSHPVLDKNYEPIDPAKLQGFVQSTDTITTYNRETYEAKIEIVQRNAIKDVEQMAFVQQWFFDDRKNVFFVRVTAVAPMVAVKDGEGNLMYSKVLFYLLNK